MRHTSLKNAQCPLLKSLSTRARDASALTVEITVAHDISMGQDVDSDIRYGVSDDTRFIGFETTDGAIMLAISPVTEWMPCPGSV